ncbi:MAG: hypothetical protein P4L27_02350 [Ignavibacteriaceae bacterium]|nr:hypothetical protein [Ignavibacteriaceae bacterium]
MSFKSDKRFVISVFIIILFNLLLIKTPLTSIFGYEFSVFNSVILVIITGLLTISYLKREENYLNKLLQISPGLLVIPIAISVINSLLTTTCSLADGFLFYLVITVPSVLIGSSLGLFAFYIYPRHPRILFIILILLTAFIPVIEIYYYPQIYFYNPLAGYFPGTIYDEGLSVSRTLVIYRIINVIFFLSIFYSINLIIKKKSGINRLIIGVVVLVIVTAFIICSPYLGFSTNKWKVESSLRGKCYTEHFEIIYDTSIDTAYLKNEIINHEYYYFELKKFFQDEPDRKITSFIFKDNKQKGELFGSENADVAKPWLFQIYTSSESYDHTLRHEIAHVFTASFGTTPFKIASSFNPALIEGIAEAAAPFYGTWYLDQIAAIAYNNNFRLKLENLYSGFNFFGQTSGLSYVYAGSFTNYLINRHGIEKFKEWYKGKPFTEVYDSSLTEIADNYYEHLSHLGFTGKQNTAQYYFGRQTIFSKFCPRYIADQLRKGWENYNDNHFAESEEIFAHINGITHNYSALYGLALSKVKLKKEEEALTLIENELPNYKNSSYYFSLELLTGDLRVMNEKYEKARDKFYELNGQNPDLHLYYLSKLRINLSANKSLIYNYITGTDSAKYEILKNYNSDSYDYSSFPVMIDLAVLLGRPYKEVIEIFNKNIIVNDIESSYGAYYLSNYMMENLDYTGGRKLAALAGRFRDSDGIELFLRSNLIKANWIYLNYDKIMKNMIFVNSPKS